MTLKEFLMKKVQLFFFLVTMILLAQVILGNALEPERVLYYKDFSGTFTMAFLCMLPTVVSYSKKELTLKQTLVRHAIQLVMIEGVMFALAVSGLGETPDKALKIVLICLSVAVIYALAILMMWYRQHLESKNLNKLLKNMQSV